MAMNDAVKRKSPEPEAEKVEKPDMETEAKPGEAEAKTTEAPQIAVAVKPASNSGEPEAKRLKPTPPDVATVRKQVEYYLSDDNLRHDKFFHDKITENGEGWLELTMILACNKMKAMRATPEDVLEALKGSKIEIREDKLALRRPGSLALPTLEQKQVHQKKSALHAHDGGVIAVVKGIPEEQSWMQIKDAVKAKLPEKVQLWFCSEVNDKHTCVLASAPFEGDIKFFDTLELEVGGLKLKTEVAHGDLLQTSLKCMPKHIREKREKEVKKRQKERNRPIVVGSQRFVTVTALRSRVKEILNSRSDGEELKADGSDFKLIKALLGFHPKGEAKSKGMKGIKVAKSSQGESRCFWMLKEEGEPEDFSAQKCLSAIEANPPYVEVEKKADASPAPKEKAEIKVPAAEVPKEAVVAEEKKDAPAAEKKTDAPAAEVPKEAAEEKKDEAKTDDAAKA